MARRMFSFIILVIVLFMLAKTNPTPSAYYNWIKYRTELKVGIPLVSTIVGNGAEFLAKLSTQRENFMFGSIYVTSIDSNNRVFVLGIANNFIPVHLTGNQLREVQQLFQSKNGSRNTVPSNQNSLPSPTNR